MSYFSITKMRGCFAALGPPVAILIAILLVVGFLYFQFSPSRAPLPHETLGEVAFTVNEEPVYHREVVDIVNELRSRMMEARRSFATITPHPREELNWWQIAVRQGVERALYLQMAKEEGINISEKDLEPWLTQRFVDEQLESFRQRAEMLYQFQVTSQQQEAERLKKEKGEKSEEYKKAVASLEELKKKSIEQVFRENFGMSQEDLRNRLESEKQRLLESEVKKRILLGSMAEDKVREAYKKKVDTSDKALRESYEQFTYQQLLISSSKHPDPVGRARKILEEIKQGLPFEKAVAKYSDREPLQGEKKEQAGTETNDRLTLMATENLQFLFQMKPGEISDVVELPIGAAIYKLIKREQKLPENFETARTFRITQMQQILGDQIFKKALSEKKRNAKITWNDDAFRLTYEFDDLMTGDLAEQLMGPTHQEKRIEILRKIMKEAENAQGDPHLSALLRYACFTQLIAEAPNEERRKALYQEQLALYDSISQEITFLPFRMEYIKLLLDAKRAEDAIAQIEDVVSFLSYDEQNEPTVNQLSQYLDKAEPIAPQSKQTIGRIRKEIEEWRKQVEEDKKARAQQEQATQPETQAPPKPVEIPGKSPQKPASKGR
jgi:hypothetical protein